MVAPKSLSLREREGPAAAGGGRVSGYGLADRRAVAASLSSHPPSAVIPRLVRGTHGSDSA